MADFTNRFLKGKNCSGNYFKYSCFLKQYFGKRLNKISINAGFTCPNRDGTLGSSGCIYCDEKGSGSAGGDLETLIGSALERTAGDMLLYFQAFSNTYANADTLKTKFDIVRRFPRIKGLIIGTRADTVDREKLALIDSFAGDRFVSLEFGLQSIGPETRTFMERGEPLEIFEKSVKMTAEFERIFIGIHVILGLPHEKEGYEIELARYINALPADGIKVHNLFIPSSARIRGLYEAGRIQLQTAEEFALSCALFLENLRKDLVILRIGGRALGEEHIAPDWARNARSVTQRIDTVLKSRCSHQGKYSAFGTY